MLLSQEELNRYSRQISMSQIGIEGQKKLSRSKVLVVGAGGLGSPALIYLAAAGVGTIGIVDGDVVDIHNLHRQIIHFTRDIGVPKAASAAETLKELNPHVQIVQYPFFLSNENAQKTIAGFDLVINANDNFPTRYLVNDVCVLLKKPLVDASIFKFEGQTSVYIPGQGCYRCLHPVPPPEDVVPTCTEAGIFGALPGVMGTFQAAEAIKVLLNIGKPLVGKVAFIDLLNGYFKVIEWSRDSQCTVCGGLSTAV